ncbi:hypothetical protein KSP40_PGU012269 [Platanthera guangdongensis]|uniref:Uncharacterized protein n=1 Tax=Platanthera guangdongensis TaxID=2320717 RepID=A0ABR2MN69_9ASPA
MDFPDVCMYAEIRTRIPDTISYQFYLDPYHLIYRLFNLQSAVLKEAIDDLEWPCSAVQIHIQPILPQ